LRRISTRQKEECIGRFHNVAEREKEKAQNLPGLGKIRRAEKEGES